MGWLAPLGTYTQLRYARASLGHFARLLGHWSWRDTDLFIYDTEIAAVPVRVFEPYARTRRAPPTATIIFFHGGGFVLGDVGEIPFLRYAKIRPVSWIF